MAVYITDYIKDPYIEKDILKGELSFSADINTKVLLVWHENITREYIDNLPNLEGIIRYGVGYDAIHLEYAKEKKIYVCNTPDYGTDEVSDTAIAMIMNITRGIFRYDFQCRNFSNNWQENTISTIKRNCDHKLGVIGAGRIGGSIILKSNALGIQTFFYDPYVSRGYEKMLNTNRYEDLNNLLNECVIISINCPLTDETTGIINEDFIDNLKNGSSIINTARGGLIKDIDIFYEPLKSGKLLNVALDVLPVEPPKDSKLINAWRKRETWLDGRLVINPHTAYYSDRSYYEMRKKAALNAKRILEGNIPFNIVNNL